MAAPETANEPGAPGTDGQGGGQEDIAQFLGQSVAEADEAKLSLVMVRDVAVVSLLLTLYGAAETWAATSGLALAALVSTVDGLVVGVAVAALLHEWGHFAGARLAGGHAPLKPMKGLAPTFPIFDFDYANNDGRAFMWMSVGGNVAHWGVVALVLTSVPLGSPGAAALAAGAIGFAVFSSAVEFPVIRRASSGVPGMEALGTIPRDFVSRYMPFAIGAAALAFLVL
jgi:hypothetical protein